MTGSVARSVSRERGGHATPAVGPTDTRCCRGQLEESYAWPASCALAVVLVATGAALRDEIQRRWYFDWLRQRREQEQEHAVVL